jgi:hypothetical protein
MPQFNPECGKFARFNEWTVRVLDHGSDQQRFCGKVLRRTVKVYIVRHATGRVEHDVPGGCLTQPHPSQIKLYNLCASMDSGLYNALHVSLAVMIDGPNPIGAFGVALSIYGEHYFHANIGYVGKDLAKLRALDLINTYAVSKYGERSYQVSCA